jgi:hypothetical protein
MYHGDLVSSGSGVDVMFSQIVVHSEFAYLTRIRIKGVSCPKVADELIVCSVGPSSGGKDI